MKSKGEDVIFLVSVQRHKKLKKKKKTPNRAVIPSIGRAVGNGLLLYTSGKTAFLKRDLAKAFICDFLFCVCVCVEGGRAF